MSNITKKMMIVASAFVIGSVVTQATEEDVNDIFHRIVELQKNKITQQIEPQKLAQIKKTAEELIFEITEKTAEMKGAQKRLEQVLESKVQEWKMDAERAPERMIELAANELQEITTKNTDYQQDLEARYQNAQQQAQEAAKANEKAKLANPAAFRIQEQIIDFQTKMAKVEEEMTDLQALTKGELQALDDTCVELKGANKLLEEAIEVLNNQLPSEDKEVDQAAVQKQKDLIQQQIDDKNSVIQNQIQQANSMAVKKDEIKQNIEKRKTAPLVIPKKPKNLTVLKNINTALDELSNITNAEEAQRFINTYSEYSFNGKPVLDYTNKQLLEGVTLLTYLSTYFFSEQQ